MQTFIMVAQLITALSILVVIHELGHFLAAKLFKIRVDKFYLFFDFLFPMPNLLKFSLFKIKKGDTEYGLGWFPMGGYVQIAGMVDENMNTEQLSQPAEPWEFRSKPAWQRMIVMLGGIIFNVALGVFIFAMMSYYYGERFTKNESIKNGLVASALAKEVGFETGDKLVSVNGKPIIHFEKAFGSDELLGDKTVYTVDRNGESKQIELPATFLSKFSENSKAEFLTPRQTFFIGDLVPSANAEKAGLKINDVILAVDTNKFAFFDEFQQLLQNKKNTKSMFTILRNSDTLKLEVAIDESGKVGFRPDTKDFAYDTIQYGFFASLPAGWDKAVETISSQIKGWGKIFNGDIAVNKAVQGPIGIAKFYGGEWIWSRFWLFTALISLGLAFANVLPIPALDGGHVVMLIIEMVTGKPISIKIQERVQTAGMIILLSLMVLIFGNDIWQLIKK
jgi:regulator of sigma E protease